MKDKPPYETEITTQAKHPAKGVDAARGNAPSETPRKPSLDYPLKPKPKGNGGAKIMGSV